MNYIKEHIISIVLVLVAITAVSFFYRMYQRDVRTLEDFMVSYEFFDKAILDYADSGTDDLERKAGDALIELKTRAALRISSLIRNDADLMNTARDIAEVSTKELNTLRAYKRAALNKITDLDALAKQCDDLTNQRKAGYARFRELGGLP